MILFLIRLLFLFLYPYFIKYYNFYNNYLTFMCFSLKVKCPLHFKCKFTMNGHKSGRMFERGEWESVWVLLLLLIILLLLLLLMWLLLLLLLVLLVIV